MPNNRLAGESSPYLLQHAGNPVDWYPFCEEAFARARGEDRPILLSVGYSSCHWCHVMAHESFEDEATAAHMNEHFVNVKVDREERPDVDEVYMHAVQRFSGGHGGWPMTLFLLPDGRPFLGGTYFPPTPRYGMPSFRQLMDYALSVYRQRRDGAEQMADQIVRDLRAYARLPREVAELSAAWLDVLAKNARDEFDSRWGGFGHAPKFPPHGTLAALLAHFARGGDRRSLGLVCGTLDAMSRGGMYDLLAGGFARYSVDERWLIPHFEKMLYDNALLVPVLLDAARASGQTRYARLARETLDWMAGEMRATDGLFYSALDADSEGVEGKFYAWTRDDLIGVLGPADGMRAADLLQVTRGGNFEHGTSVLRLERPGEELSPADLALWDRARPALLAARARRPRPGLDDKALVAWNGLAISAFARAGAALDEPRYAEIAARAARFLLDSCTVDGRLRHAWKNGPSKVLAFCDDHAALGLACLDLWEATYDAAWIDAASRLADALVEQFWDEDDGGLFFAARDAEALLSRGKHLLGGALPSANGLAALLFARLDALCGREELGTKADRILRSYQVLLDGAPRALGVEAIAASLRAQGGLEVAIVGEPGAPATQALLAELRRRPLPFASTVLAAPTDVSKLVNKIKWLHGKTLDGNHAAAAWVCRGRSCLSPAHDPAELASRLDEANAPREAVPDADA
jgi:uncharacterized protein YyaL (SSP411 family)